MKQPEKPQRPAIVVHGGAGPDSDFIQENIEGYKAGLAEALEKGYAVLDAGRTAVDAVEAAVIAMEDNPLFNCGKGSALNAAGEIEMCSAIMDGKKVRGGGVAIVTGVKNPVSLAKVVMDKKNCLYLGADGATKFAKEIGAEFRPTEYFITEHEKEEFEKKEEEQSEKQDSGESFKGHGTVGAVAVDVHGNVASATSTGGLTYCHEGRIGDSSMIGVGCYANNNSCAASGTGDGEYMIRGVVCHSVACLVNFKGMGVDEACDQIIHKENSTSEGDLGVIAIDKHGNMGLEFNTERMHRGFKTADEMQVKIYKDE